MGTVLGACRITDKTPCHNGFRAVLGVGRDAGACPQTYPPKMWKTHFARHYGEEDRSAPFRADVAAVVNRISPNTNKY